MIHLLEVSKEQNDTEKYIVLLCDYITRKGTARTSGLEIRVLKSIVLLHCSFYSQRNVVVRTGE